ncbi:MAG: 50S ribosomal protein L13 [Phycisphaeraceae bacterium]|nr:50S ribosomal protein L13 [Phycisphaeraceae bacterium]
MNRQTFQAKPGQVKQNWVVIDAADQVLGRLSAKVAMLLMGKHKPEYTPQTDTGDFVVVINADKIRILGSKPELKTFQTYSGYPGGQKRMTYKWMLANKPDLLVERSIRRMLPKTKLGSHMIGKLKIYRGAEHPHSSQKPQTVQV